MKLDKIFILIVVNLFLSVCSYSKIINQVQLNLNIDYDTSEDVKLSHINGLQSVNFNDLENKLTNLIPQTDFNCISVGIIRNSQLSWVNSFGSRPNNPNLIYGIASITKCFTATAILQLYDRNLLNISEDVSNYLPFQLRNPNFQNTPITVEMLLTHTAGLAGTHPHYTNFTGFDLFPKIGLSVESYPPFPEFIVAHLNSSGVYYSPSIWSTNSPGSVFQYSNTGYGILGHIIECITNKNLTEYFQTNIFIPLNMTNIGFSHLNFDLGDLITPYHWDENLEGTQGYYMELPFYSIPPIGNTGLMASIPDLAKFLVAHMNEGQYNNICLLNASSANLMHSSVLSNYGMGWHNDLEKGQGHTGEEWGYRVELRYFFSGEIAPEKIGIIFMGNVGGNDMSTQKDSIFQFIRNWVRDEMYSNNQAIGSFQINLLVLLGIFVVLLLILKQFRNFEP
jgi:CubicO group peptidase (beta-lactamase class C family)